MTDALHDLRFPVGEFEVPGDVGAARISGWVDEIEALPGLLRSTVSGMDATQLGTPYRPEGWTVQKVVHHLADSHLNSFVRFKWALTEERPTIKAYDEVRWAETPDAGSAPLGPSLDWLDALHKRWCVLLRALSPEQLDREFVHPVSGPVSLRVNVGIYAWHGRHHRAHITSLAARQGWSLPTAS